MAEATDLAAVRQQVEAESQEEGGEGQETQFEDGFSWKTVIGALFVGFIMLPGALYLGLMAGQGLGPAAELDKPNGDSEIHEEGFERDQEAERQPASPPAPRGAQVDGAPREPRAHSHA